MTLTPPPLTVIRRIKRFAPLQLGKMLAVMYGVMGLIFCPFFLLFSLFAPHPQGAHAPAMFWLGSGFAIMLPFLYAGMGFVGGVISGFVYNLIAQWVGGIEVEVE